MYINETVYHTRKGKIMKDLKVVRRPYRPDVVLIDGNALAFRSLFASEHLSVKVKGKHIFTGMAYGFLRKLAEIRNKFNPKSFVVVWDGGSKRKKEIFPEYKGTRKIVSNKMSFDDIVASLDSCRKLVKLLGISQYRIKGEEGDDLIGSYVAQHKDKIILVVTNDHDMYQCLQYSHVKILKFKQREKDEFWCIERFIRTHQGMLPEYYPHFLSIAGDKTDEIPGVKGIGDVKGYQLLLQVDPPTVSNLYKNIEKLVMTPHIKSLLEKDKEKAELFLTITTLVEDLELVPLETPRLRRHKLVTFFEKLKFRSVLNNDEAMRIICGLGSEG